MKLPFQFNWRTNDRFCDIHGSISSYTCPHCLHVHTTTLGQDIIKSGYLAVVFINMNHISVVLIITIDISTLVFIAAGSNLHRGSCIMFASTSHSFGCLYYRIVIIALMTTSVQNMLGKIALFTAQIIQSNFGDFACSQSDWRLPR